MLALLALAGLLYVGDWLAARSRGPRAFGSVVVQPYYAVALKDGKTEFIMLAPETHACVHALFPHFGAAPCWYLEGHKRQRIDVGQNGGLPMDGAHLPWIETASDGRPLRAHPYSISQLQ
jgi:hypothetical protein